jgi:hypothetical protein
MAVYEIPLIDPPQLFSISLNGVTYELRVLWREVRDPDGNQLGGWTLDIVGEDGVTILVGIPMLPGLDLLAQYAYLNIGGQLFVQNDSDWTQPPTFGDLGKTSHLYFVA